MTFVPSSAFAIKIPFSAEFTADSQDVLKKKQKKKVSNVKFSIGLALGRLKKCLTNCEKRMSPTHPHRDIHIQICNCLLLHTSEKIG